ncbi:MAG TPA: hypothetical protein VKZ88_00815 [Fibrobacteria bacterium]|nr:hypothetical protein [Fibrobacteria bacterium]
MKVKHTDFRPARRPRYVPSGRPRRKFPLIRILLLIALGLFVYSRLDTLWAVASESLRPATVWHKVTGAIFGGDESSGELPLAWSRDSSRVTLDCPRGLDAACCESLSAVNENLCGATAALLEKARWQGELSGPRETPRPLRLEARAVVSDLGEWSHELAGVRGEDPSGPYAYRRAAGSHAWCDARRGCLTRPRAQPPLAAGRLLSSGRADPIRGGATIVQWVAATPRVRAILPGRVTAVDSATGRGPAAIVHVYHGTELYATYGPLTPAAGVRPGALVKTGSYLGDAPAPVKTGLYRLTMNIRQGGQPLDAATLWGQAADRASSSVAEDGPRLAGPP